MTSDPPQSDDLDARPRAQTEEFLRLFGMAYRHVFALVRSLLPHTEDVEEVMQETSLILWRKFEEFQPEGDFVRWACGIAYNQARRQRRVSKRLPLGFGDEVLERIVLQREADSPQLESRRRHLLACLSKLSERDRSLVNCCYRAAGTIKQAALELGTPVSTLYKKLRRIRQLLFRCVDKQMQQEGAP